MIKNIIALLLLLSLFSCEEQNKIELPQDVRLVCIGNKYQVSRKLGYSIGVNPSTLHVGDTVRFYGFGDNYPYSVTRIWYYSIEKANNSFVNLDPTKPKQAFEITLKKLEDVLE